MYSALSSSLYLMLAEQGVVLFIPLHGLYKHEY